MNTTYRIPAPYAEQFLKLADDYVCDSPVRPERFIEKMKRNRGAVSGLTQTGLDENGLERKNPVIAALGDSVTAGHFETLLPRDPEALRTGFERMLRGEEAAPVEITDAREEQVCLANVRAVWDQAADAGIPWKLLLANGVNHPSVEGHEVYAKVLMKLFEDQTRR